MAFNKPPKPNFLDKRKEALKSSPVTPTSGIKPTSSSLLDVMTDNNEFGSLLGYDFSGVNIVDEIKKSIGEIENIRKRPVICYVGNTIYGSANDFNNSIVAPDTLPFFEMVRNIPEDIKEIDVVLETPGGSGTIIPKLVDALRGRFDHVGFIILNSAMSSGTIFASSADEIIMSSTSHLGPIDPQFQKNGSFFPAQSMLSLIEDIRVRTNEKIKGGAPADWTDMMMIQRIDANDIAKAMSASAYSIKLVESYLYNYKFKYWGHHARSGGHAVTDDDKKQRAKEIASLLCNHDQWKDHGHAINREAAWEVCQLKIVHSEDIEGLDRAMRRMWALFYWLFYYKRIAKIFLSQNYSVIKSYNLPEKLS